jgi:hypothetical protein
MGNIFGTRSETIRKRQRALGKLLKTNGVLVEKLPDRQRRGLKKEMENFQKAVVLTRNKKTLRTFE